MDIRSSGILLFSHDSVTQTTSALEQLTTTERSSIFGTRLRTLVERNDGKLCQLAFELLTQNRLGRVDVEQSWVDPAKMSLIALLSLRFKRSAAGC